jgi:hypothetical protein
MSLANDVAANAKIAQGRLEPRFQRSLSPAGAPHQAKVRLLRRAAKHAAPHFGVSVAAGPKVNDTPSSSQWSTGRGKRPPLPARH